MPDYVFTVTFHGTGETPEEAWEAIVSNNSLDELLAMPEDYEIENGEEDSDDADAGGAV